MLVDSLLNLMNPRRPEANQDELPPGVDPLSNAKHLLPLMLLGMTDEESSIQSSCLRQVEAAAGVYSQKLGLSPTIDNKVLTRGTQYVICLFICC